MGEYKSTLINKRYIDFYDLTVTNKIGSLSNRIKVPMVTGYFPIMNYASLVNKIPNFVNDSNFQTSRLLFF